MGEPSELAIRHDVNFWLGQWRLDRILPAIQPYTLTHRASTSLYELTLECNAIGNSRGESDADKVFVELKLASCFGDPIRDFKGWDWWAVLVTPQGPAWPYEMEMNGYAEWEIEGSHLQDFLRIQISEPAEVIALKKAMGRCL